MADDRRGVCAPLDPRLRECERAIRAKIGSKSAQNSPCPGPKVATKSSKLGRRGIVLRRTILNLNIQ